jgi:hypothetical protein
VPRSESLVIVWGLPFGRVPLYIVAGPDDAVR